MRAPPTPSQAEEAFNTLFESYLAQIENEWLGFDPLDNHASNILAAKYEKAKVEDVAVT